MPTVPGDYASGAACRPGNYARTTRPDYGVRAELSPGPTVIRRADGQLFQDNRADPVDDAGRLCQPTADQPDPVSDDGAYVQLGDRATMPAGARIAHVTGDYASRAIKLSTGEAPTGRQNTPGDYANRTVAYHGAAPGSGRMRCPHPSPAPGNYASRSVPLADGCHVRAFTQARRDPPVAAAERTPRSRLTGSNRTYVR